MSSVSYDNVKISVEFAPEDGKMNSGESLSKLIGKAAFHVSDGNIHVTAEEKADWNAKASKSDIPPTLPADGGNAETVGGKHSSDFLNYIGAVSDLFAVNQTCVCRYNEATLNTPLKKGLTDSGVGLCIVNNEAGTEYTTYLVIPAGSSDYYAASSRDGVEHVAWHKVSDGGNAASLGSKSPQQFMQYLGIQGDTTTLSDANYKINYIADFSETVATAMGLPVAGWYHIMYLMHTNTGYGCQIAFPLNFDGAAYWRGSIGTTWGAWKNIADGGNAKSLDGYVVESGTDLYSPLSSHNGRVAMGTFANGDYDCAFVDVIGANGNRMRLQLSSHADEIARFYKYNAAANTWSEVGTLTSYQASMASAWGNTASNVGLHNISSGSAAADATNCPPGAWYGQYE